MAKTRSKTGTTKAVTKAKAAKAGAKKAKAQGRNTSKAAKKGAKAVKDKAAAKRTADSKLIARLFPDGVTRCSWGDGEAKMGTWYVGYHDEEFGIDRPLTDVQCLEYLTIQGMQAGLNFELVMKKRENFRRAFKDYELETVANLSESYLTSLKEDASIIRNRLKIWSVRTNAQAMLALREELGDGNSDVFLDHARTFFPNGEQIVHAPETMGEFPDTCVYSDAFAKDLKKRGFKFVGDRIVYSFCESLGLINDHTFGCFRGGKKRTCQH